MGPRRVLFERVSALLLTEVHRGLSVASCWLLFKRTCCKHHVQLPIQETYAREKDVNAFRFATSGLVLRWTRGDYDELWTVFIIVNFQEIATIFIMALIKLAAAFFAATALQVYARVSI